MQRKTFRKCLWQHSSRALNGKSRVEQICVYSRGECIMSNNTIRIISGVILLALVGFCLYMGQQATLIAIGIIGPFVIDEIITNFYDQPRTSIRYLLAQAIYLGCYYFFNFYQISNSSFNFWISAGIVLNILLFLYLFVIYKKSETLLKIFKATSWGAGLFLSLIHI